MAYARVLSATGWIRGKHGSCASSEHVDSVSCAQRPVWRFDGHARAVAGE